MYLIEELRDAMIEREIDNYVSADIFQFNQSHFLQDSLTKNDYEE